jgi:hypothetical protein
VAWTGWTTIQRRHVPALGEAWDLSKRPPLHLLLPKVMTSILMYVGMGGCLGWQDGSSLVDPEDCHSKAFRTKNWMTKPFNASACEWTDVLARTVRRSIPTCVYSGTMPVLLTTAVYPEYPGFLGIPFARNDLPLRGRLNIACRSHAESALHAHGDLTFNHALEPLGYCVLNPETGQTSQRGVCVGGV